jgi:hypothetical protein
MSGSNRKPWYKSVTMLAAYAALVLSLLDAGEQLSKSQGLSWRTAAMALVGAVTAWGRLNARTIISAWADGEDQEDKAP